MYAFLTVERTRTSPDKSEDEILAKEVDGIDLIISGHSHTELAQPIIVNDTVIASAVSITIILATSLFNIKTENTSWTNIN